MNKVIRTPSYFLEDTFTKDDLKTGMRVTLRNGLQYLVMLDCYKDSFSNDKKEESNHGALTNISRPGWMSLKDYNQDLVYEGFSGENEWDIIRVEYPEYVSTAISGLQSKGGWIILWEPKPEPTPEPRTVTMEEVCKMFGEDVVISKDDS